MIKRVKATKIGDVLIAKTSDTSKRYMQLVAIDKSQLNSDVLRAFKKIYPIEAEPSLEEIVSDEVDFYTHSDSIAGIKLEYWKLVGNISKIGDIDKILFYETDELQNIFGVWVTKWWTWRINQEEYEYSRKPKRKYKGRGAEPGLVFPPFSIIERLQGTFVSYHPEYK